MKSCPTCNRTFEDSFTFCLVDGSVLSAPIDPHATLIIPEARQTEPPLTEILPVEETREEIPPTVASPQPQRKPEESIPTIAAPALRFDSPKIGDLSFNPARKSKRLAQIIIGLAVLVGVGLALFLIISYRTKEGGSSKSSTAPNNSRAGNNQAADSSSEEYPPAPDVELKTLENGRFRLSQLRGQVVVLNFWATWCIPCREQIPVLNDMQTVFGQRGLSVVGVSHPSDTIEDIEGFQSQLKQNYTLLLGNETELGKFEMGVGLPTTLIIDRSGRIQQKIIGIFERTKLEETIQKSLDPGKMG